MSCCHVQPYPVVEMAYQQRQEGYFQLGSYIDGEGNAARTRFAHTQPVMLVYSQVRSGGLSLLIASSHHGQEAVSRPCLKALEACLP
jgi:hypothetical protein